MLLGNTAARAECAPVLELRGVSLRSWGSFVAVSVSYIEDTDDAAVPTSGASCATTAAAYSTMYGYRHGDA